MLITVFKNSREGSIKRALTCFQGDCFGNSWLYIGQKFDKFSVWQKLVWLVSRMEMIMRFPLMDQTLNSKRKSGGDNSPPRKVGKPFLKVERHEITVIDVDWGSRHVFHNSNHIK